METIEELQEFVGAVTQSNVRGRLIDRGEARTIIRRDGHLPEDAPPLGETLDIDLSEYGFSLLRACLVLRERAGNSTIWRAGFRKAANAFEALVRIAEESNDPGTKGVALRRLTRLPARGRAVDFLAQLATRNDVTFAPVAVRVLASEVGEAGLARLRLLFETDAVVEPNAKHTLRRLATHYCWGRS